MKAVGSKEYFTWADRTFDVREAFDKPEALTSIRVIELCTLILGPATTDFLGEFGAEVIKVELPGTGDTMRYVPPDGWFWRNLCFGFATQNHGKYHVGIDVHDPEGKELFRRLVAKADVVVENVRPGTMDRWELGYRQLSQVNPRLIYLAATGFGQWGPFSVGRASYDLLAQAASGLASITGFSGRSPMKSGIFLGDYFGALLNCIAIMAALHSRERSGQGQFIELSQAEGLMRSMDWTWIFQGLSGKERERSGNRDVAISPSDIFRCQDGLVAIAAGCDEEFTGLCKAIGQPALAKDKRFSTLKARLMEEHNVALNKIIAAWAVNRTVTEVDVLGQKFGFATAPVQSAKDHHADAHLRARGAVWQYEDPVYGEVVEYGSAPKLSKTPGRIKWLSRPVGFHNQYVFRKLLGLTSAQITALEEQRVIGKWADRVGAKPPEDWTPGKGQVF
ncbi:MAG TPA: CoA transferase [Candidatus Acidoferrum sp.]|nr:CoA transferase [Candidatus Acidoferrum sp.]